MKYHRQITKGVISKIEPKDLYLTVTAETDHEGKHYTTILRVGFTNYCLAIGDLLSWSSFYDGTGSRVLWWSSSACGQRLCKLWLVVVESQKTVPKKET
jgi:hypothetical protein